MKRKEQKNFFMQILINMNNWKENERNGDGKIFLKNLIDLNENLK